MPKKPPKQAVALTPLAAKFTAAAAGSQIISRDEIYHRLEWYLHASHDPNGPHVIPPAAPITQLVTVPLSALYVDINQQSSITVPAWHSPLFNGIRFEWIGVQGAFKGISELQTFGDLIGCAVHGYKAASWQVT